MTTLYPTLPSVQPRVLLVEDDPIQAKILATVVRKLGFEPLGPATTAEDALALCRQDWPALAILDIGLPGVMDGIDLANCLSQLGKLPLIFLSAAANDVAMQQRMVPARPLALLGKPYPIDTLQHLISHSLAHTTTDVVPVITNAAAAAPSIDWVFVREGGTLLRVDMADIVCAYVDQQHAVLVLASGRRHSVRLTLSEVMSYLPAAAFIQCHRSWLVNIRYVEEVDLATDLIRLAGDVKAAIGRTYRRQVLQHLRIIG